MITRPGYVTANGTPPARAVRAVIEEHMEGLSRLNRLRAYYDGRHPICARQRKSGLPNARLVNGFPHYITTMAAGYLIGSPVTYAAEGRQRLALESVLRDLRAANIDSVDAELARDASIFGKGVELIYADEQARARTAALDPRRAFVVYDDTVACKPLFGVLLTGTCDECGRDGGMRVDVYTATGEARYLCRDALRLEAGDLVHTRPHYFGGVPMVEYWNSPDERGDFEGVLTLIDAYDQLQSDRVNDKQQFVDALLLLYGCTLETDALGRSPGQQLREDKALALPDSDARAEWLCKQLSESDTEVLRRALREDIHKMSMIPDLTDEQFAGNSSGVAMKYKLLGLEQLTKVKERCFREALTQRLERFAAFQERRGAPRLNVGEVRVEFHRALPVNALEEAQTVNLLRGLVDDDELRRRLQHES